MGTFLRPNGSTLAGVYSQLEYLNSLADRMLADTTPIVELMLGIINQQNREKQELGNRASLCFGVHTVPVLAPGANLLLVLSLSAAAFRFLVRVK